MVGEVNVSRATLEYLALVGFLLDIHCVGESTYLWDPEPLIAERLVYCTGQSSWSQPLSERRCGFVVSRATDLKLP